MSRPPTAAPRRLLLAAVADGGASDPRPPRELAAIGAALRERGAGVSLVDLRPTGGDARGLTGRPADAVLLWGEDTDTLARLARELRAARPELELLAGGPGLDPDRLLGGRAVDLVVLEGDAWTVDRWYRRRLAGRDEVGCRGLARRGPGGAVVREPVPAPPTDPDSLPTPAWDLVDLATYARRGRRQAPLVTGHSCGPRCTVCHHSYGHSFRGRSVGQVLAEVEELVARGIARLTIEDEPFNLDPGRAARLLDGIVERAPRLRLRLAHPLRADRIDAELARALARAGLRRVELQLEGASPRAQREARLNLSLEAARRGIEDLAAAGVHTRGRFTLGRPDESRAEQRATVAWARRSRLDAVDFRGGSGRLPAWLGFHLHPPRLWRRIRPGGRILRAR